MLVRYITSAMTGAPTWNGTAGTGITVLDAILVNGFNSGTCTINQSAGVATATRVGHGFTDKVVVRIEDADQEDYNGDHRITVVDADTFTFAVDAGAVTPATGTITCKVAPLGWTKPFSGTQKAVYQQGAGSLGLVMRALDDGTKPDARQINVVMAESASDVDTLVDPFPTTAMVNQTSAYTSILKSTSANSTNRAYIIWGNERFLCVSSQYDGTYYSPPEYFGDIDRFDGTDAFGVVCGPSTSTNGSASTVTIASAMSSSQNLSGTYSANLGAGVIARAGNGTSKSAICTNMGQANSASNTISGSSTISASVKPYGSSYGWASRAVVRDSGGIRGCLLSIYHLVIAGTHGTSIDSGLVGLPAGSSLVYLNYRKSLGGLEDGSILIDAWGES